MIGSFGHGAMKLPGFQGFSKIDASFLFMQKILICVE